MIDALNASFLVKSNELLVSGLCWHSVNWRCKADRADREEELEAGSVLTVIPYPECIDSVPVDALWSDVCRPTAWEVVDLTRPTAIAPLVPLVAVVAVSPSATADHTRGNLPTEALWVRPASTRGPQARRSDPYVRLGAPALLLNHFETSPGRASQVTRATRVTFGTAIQPDPLAAPRRALDS